MTNSILFTFVGSHDPYNADGTEGPILSYLNTKYFSKIYLFYTTKDFLKRAYELANIIKSKNKKTDIEFIESSHSPGRYKSKEFFKQIRKRVLQRSFKAGKW